MIECMKIDELKPYLLNKASTHNFRIPVYNIFGIVTLETFVEMPDCYIRMIPASRHGVLIPFRVYNSGIKTNINTGYRYGKQYNIKIEAVYGIDITYDEILSEMDKYHTSDSVLRYGLDGLLDELI